MDKPAKTIRIFFKHLGKVFEVQAAQGKTLLETAHKNSIPLEGACEGSLACSTCHIICPEGVFDPSAVSDRENDLLDMAYGLQPTSRLGCQITVSPDMLDKTFEIPRCTRNLAVDGYKPPQH